MTNTSRIALAALALVAGAAALVACRSVSKDDVERTLLALPKNAPFAKLGIERHVMKIDLGGETRDVEVLCVHAPRNAHFGGDNRPAVVLVHGTPGSLFTWTDLVCGKGTAPGLADQFDVYAIDVLGHGSTRTDAAPVTFQKCADWVAGAVRGLNIGPVHLVGNSYGGEFCWRAALDHPDLFRTLTLMDSAGYKRPDDGWLPEETAMREMTLAPIGWAFLTREKTRGALEPHFPFAMTNDQVEECYAVSANASNWRAMVDLARDESGTRESEIAHLSLPTLLLWGADDIAYPVERVARRFERDVMNSELHVIPHCGHYPQETVPADVAATLTAFLLQHP